MKKKLIIIFIVISLFITSWNLSDVKFDDPNKDKLLIEIVKYVLDKGHYQSKDVNNELSEKIFNTYLDLIDSQKKYFLISDLKEFKKYKLQLDDQWLSYDLAFFNLTFERLLQRMNEVEAFLPSLFENRFNFELKEEINFDFKNMSYSKNNRERIDRWRKQFKYTALDIYDIKISEKKLAFKNNKDLKLKSNSELLNESTELVKKNINQVFDLINDLEKKDWFSTYINSFVTQFDPHTYYFQPEAKERFDMNISGKFDGIGARLSKKDGGIEIVEIILGGPVWRDKKIEIGDEIIKVGQADQLPVGVIGMRLEDAIKLIKGPKGTEVRLTLRKKIDGEIKVVSIIRDEVLLEETYAKSTIIKKNNKSFGLISLPKFYVDFDNYKEKNCAADVKNEILKLKKEGIQGLVLDLRNNGGGALQTVVEMTGLFIEKGPIVQVKSTGNRKKILSDNDPSIVWDGPLVVLVNQMSASASEILAAALQDYGRAIIIGSTQSFGKGTVQNIVDLNRFLSNSQFDLGALKITTDKFYRINGGSVQIEGVKSDIVIPNSYSFLEIGESDEKNPLSWDQIDPASYSLWNGYFNFKDVIDDGNDRVNKSQLASLINENAKWIASKRDLKSFSLNYNSFKNTQNRDKDYISKFDKIKDYKNDLIFDLLANEKKSLKESNELLERRKTWHSSLQSDFYLNESINVLLNLKSKNIEVKKILAKID
ncbi:MAG: carboxy terminal-processing peptidase [Flavobacteriales bacterium]|jgi:carboxyl-terminal processing protease|tara:strand:+ start:2892 stop:5021 length:2130 start_codon:yes stop_codon:yes gene_type:complete